jgi:hypothetical protein
VSVDTNTIAGTLQDGITSVSQQSDAWRDALPKLVTSLNDLEARASGDVKVTLNDTINQVSMLRDQTLAMAESMAKDTISYAAITAECGASYFQSSVIAYLQYLKARVLNQSTPPPPSRVCTFNPDHVDVDPATLPGSGKTWLVQVYGYNFLSQSAPAVQVLDGSNHLVRAAKNQPVPTSLYQMQLQLVAEDLAGLAPGFRVGMVWPSGDRNFISLNVATPAHLEVVGFEFPSVVTVNQPVSARVSVKNTGTADSGAFVIQWLPDAGRSHPVTASVLTLPGNGSQTYDLPFYTFAQADYFNTPQVEPIPGLKTAVQLIGNSGVGTNSTATGSFTLDNLPFHTLLPIKITNPDVNHDWASYQQLVGVHPGDIVTVTDAGGCVQTGGHGATWKRYVDPIAPDSPNLYHGLIAVVPLMPLRHGSPPPTGTRLQDVIGQPIRIPLNVSPAPEFWLGYEDQGYGDNGYSGHDNGTDNQCANYFGAWVTVQIQRN